MSQEIFDLTGPLFANADFSEAMLFFDPVRKLPSDLEFSVWGVTLFADEKLQRRCGLISSEVFVAGLSKLCFRGLIGGKVSISLYAEGDPMHFFETSSGKKVRIGRSWPYEDASATPYEFMSTIFWPKGFCSLVLAAMGSVSLEFDTRTCVDLKEFIRRPESFPPVTP